MAHNRPQAWSPQTIQWANVSLRVEDLGASEREKYLCSCETRARVIEDGKIRWHERAPAHVHWDKRAFEFGASPLCVSGAFGSSKTYALCLKALYLSALYPKNRGLIARKVSKELTLTTQRTFFKLCPAAAYDPARGGRRADNEGVIRLADSQSEILWIHTDDPDIDRVIRGLEVNWFFIDQAEEVSEDLFDTLLARLGRWDEAEVPLAFIEARGGLDRWPWRNQETGKPIPPTYAMIGCNPDAESHWIWRRFHPESRDWKEVYQEQGYRMIEMASYENKFLPDQNVSEMLLRDESWKRRLFYGKWGIPEGQIHHVRKESLIPGTRQIVDWVRSKATLHRALDHGDASPTVCLWWGIDRDGNVFIYREYYQADRLVSEHRRDITRLSDQEIYTTNLADPSMFYKTMQKYGGRWSFSDEYSDRNPRHGCNPDTAVNWYPADNDEMGTRNLINEYLRPQGTGEIHRGESPRHVGGMVIETGREIPRPHPLTGEYGYWPRLYFIQKSGELLDGCDKTVREIQAQRRLRVGSENGRPVFSDEREESVPDHAYDALRYAISSRAAACSVTGRRYGRKTFYGTRDELLKFNRQGGWERLRRQAQE